MILLTNACEYTTILSFFAKGIRDRLHILYKVRKQAKLASYLQVDKSDLEVCPYFCQTYGPS